MTVSRVELYEVLQPSLGKEAARKLTDAMAMESEVATKADLAALEARLDARLSAMEAKLTRWMLGTMMPVWFGTFGIIVAILLKM